MAFGRRSNPLYLYFSQRPARSLICCFFTLSQSRTGLFHLPPITFEWNMYPWNLLRAIVVPSTYVDAHDGALVQTNAYEDFAGDVPRRAWRQVRPPPLSAMGTALEARASSSGRATILASED